MNVSLEENVIHYINEFKIVLQRCNRSMRCGTVAVLPVQF